MKNQLDLQKPPPPGKPIFWNIPLLVSLGMLVAGLVVVLFSLTEKKTMLLVKCLGPILVMLGVTCMLLRILFTYKPTCLVRREGRRKKEKKGNFEEENDKLESRNHQGRRVKKQPKNLRAFTIETSDDEFVETSNMKENIGSKRSPRKPVSDVVIKVSKLE